MCVAIGYTITKVRTRSKMVPLCEMDLDSGRDMEMERRFKEELEEESKVELRGIKKYFKKVINIFT